MPRDQAQDFIVRIAFKILDVVDQLNGSCNHRLPSKHSVSFATLHKANSTNGQLMASFLYNMSFIKSIHCTRL